jgi:hypothetical protein
MLSHGAAHQLACLRHGCREPSPGFLASLQWLGVRKAGWMRPPSAGDFARLRAGSRRCVTSVAPLPHPCDRSQSKVAHECITITIFSERSTGSRRVGGSLYTCYSSLLFCHAEEQRPGVQPLDFALEPRRQVPRSVVRPGMEADGGEAGVCPGNGARPPVGRRVAPGVGGRPGAGFLAAAQGV